MTNPNLYSTIESPKFVFTFTTYQLAVLAALDMGAETSVEIMELIEEGPIDKFARRRVCEALKTLDACEVLERELIDGTRFASIRPEAADLVQHALEQAGLAGEAE